MANSPKLADLDVILNKQWSRTISMEKFRKTGENTPKTEDNNALQVIDMSKLVVHELVGVGAIGKVHRGIYNGKEVAIKLLDCSKGQAGDGISDWRRVCLMRELKTWRKLSHPNIVKLIGASPGVVDKNAFSTRCCLVSEYMSNGCLRDYLMSHKKLGFGKVLQLSIDIAKGLEYLHEKKIIHRDVKTKNILLDSNMRAKIGDFDSARMEASTPYETMSGEIGTIGYMAPEVFDGREYDCKSDVYSFGICLLEIYNCDMAYGMLCLSLADITKGLVYRNLRPKIPKSCPSELAYVMKRCWKKDPKKRPTMSEVVRMLENINPSKPGASLHPTKEFKRSSSEPWSNSSSDGSNKSSVKQNDSELLWMRTLSMKVNWP